MTTSSKSPELVPDLSEWKDTISPVEATRDAEYFSIRTYVGNSKLNHVVTYDKDKNQIGTFQYTPQKGFTYKPEYLKKPNTVVCLSSVYIGYLAALGLTDKIVGVGNLNHVSNIEVKSNPKVKEVGYLGQLNMETLISLNPKYVLVDDFDVDEQLETTLEDAGIMLVRCNPFREKTPLARAEWIKFFGVLFDEYNKACSLYDDTKFTYMLIKKEAQMNKTKPTVICNAPYGDQWTIPGGNSFQAKLIEDAGGTYLFSSDTSSMTLHKGFEFMLSHAKDADIWMHIGTHNSKASMLAENENYKEFKAFKQGNLFNNTKNTTEGGGIPYWETAGVFPDFVLRDLMHVFHPRSTSNYKFHYYHKLE